MNRLFSIILVFFFVLPNGVWASQDIIVQGLFSSKAVVQIDGKRRVIAVGETSPEGVKLISVDTDQVTLEVDGKRQSYSMGASVSLNFTKAKSVEENVFVNDQGMFMSLGSINGQSVRFLVDTGAAFVAMNTTQAKRLGVRYEVDGNAATASTASGFVKAYKVRLKSVVLGAIKRRNIEAVVIDGKHPGPILLGMSFLRDLKVEKVGNKLTLKSR